jgi:hypothetical protein
MVKYKRIIGSRNPEDSYFLGTCAVAHQSIGTARRGRGVRTGCSAEDYNSSPSDFRYYLLEGLKKHKRNTAGRYPGS